MKTYIVYMHISTSEKKYIGITSLSTEKRWKNGNGYKKQPYFHRAINKYGWDNFQHIIIARGLSEEEAKWLEIELIKELDTINSKKGYNLSRGGDGNNPTEETRKKMSESQKGKHNGELNPNYGRNPMDYMSEETKKERSKKLSKANSGKNNPMYGRNGELNPFYGKKHSEESLKKIRKSIICLTTKRIFFSVSDASEYYNIHKGNISTCCKGKNKSAGKFPDGTPLVWRYIRWNHNKKYRIRRGDV